MKKYPIYIQDNEFSCGAYCIKMILKYYHFNDEIKEIKKHCKLTSKGVNIYGLIKGFEYYNIEAKECVCDGDTLLNETTLPCIIQVIKDDQIHFMVLYKVNKNSVIIGDPTLGLRKLSHQEIKAIYSGVCLGIEHVGRPKKVANYHSFYHFILRHLKDNYHLIIRLTFYSVLIAILSVASSFYFLILIDNLKNKDYIFIVSFTALLMVGTVFKGFLEYIRAKLAIYIKGHFKQQFVNNSLINMTSLSLNYFKIHQEATLLAKVKNLYQLSDFFVKLYTTLFIDSILIICILGALSLFSLELTLIIINLVLITCLIYFKNIKKVSLISKEVIIKDDLKHQTTVELLLNMANIQQFNLKKLMESKINTYFKAHQDVVVKKAMAYNQRNSFIELAFQLLSYVVIIPTFLMYKQGSLSIGGIMAVYLLTSYLKRPVINIASLVIKKNEIKIMFERYKDILPDQKVNKEKIKEQITKIEVDHISYSYGYHKPMLQHVDLLIDHSLWLKGDNGSGKTTLLQLIMGYDTLLKGDIRINGISINDIDLNSLYERIIYLGKKPIFFNESLRFNLLLNDDSKANEVISLLEIFDVPELLGKLDEVINQNGGFLSPMQQQIVMLIRAIVKQPDVLILDEAICYVDEEYAKKISEYIDTYLNQTMVIITSNQTNIVNENYNCAIIQAGKIIC